MEILKIISEIMIFVLGAASIILLSLNNRYSKRGDVAGTGFRALLVLREEKIKWKMQN